MPAPYNHASGLPGVYDRTPDFPDWTRVLFREDRIAQAAEMMELQSIIEGRGRRVGNLVARDGDRVDGADIFVDVATGDVTCAAGRVYVRGDVRLVSASVLPGLPMQGEVLVGVRILRTIITAADEPALYGLHPGSAGEGEPGAGREVEAIAWGWDGDGDPGDLHPVYTIKDGVVIDQTPPPNLTGINQAISVYDYDAHGNYVAQGCRVAAIGKIGGAQHFSIGEGVANIMGFKRSRTTALRHIEPEAPDLRTINSEPHTFANGGSGPAVIKVNRPPINTLITAIVTAQKTVNVVKGTTGSLDLLPDSSVTALITVSQGGTTYVQGVDYQLNADRVDWSLPGAEPSSGSTYSVTYRHLTAVTPAAVDETSVTLTGGVTGTSVFLTYSAKLPRIDLLCLNDEGHSVYIKGVSAGRPRRPVAPSSLLALAAVENNWIERPRITNTDIRSIPYKEMWHYMRRLFDALDLIALERLRRQIDSREPVAKRGVFVDPWIDDSYRDQGVAQTAALMDGAMRLAVLPSFHRPSHTNAICLDYTDEIIVRQELKTACRKVNPYQNFDPIPLEMSVDPSEDFWTEFETQFLSETTRNITQTVWQAGTGIINQWGLTGADANFLFAGGTITREIGEEVLEVERRTQSLEFLRQISVNFTVRGLNNGEQVTALTFDGLNVLPGAPVTANASGIASGVFTIPPNVTSGTKLVVATGASGRQAMATFVGQGLVEIDVRQRRFVTLTLTDPIAQTFTLTEPRHITGVNLKWCAKGSEANPCVVQIRTVENGIPTGTVLAQKRVNMATVVLNQWTEVRFDFPLFLPVDREFCFVVLTDDPDHSLATATLGEFDADNNIWVAAQPYSVGVMLTSSNASTWTPHQKEDVTFQLVAAKFAPTTKTVNLGSFSVTNMSDLMLRSAFDLPTEEASIRFELVRAGGEVVQVIPRRNIEFTEFITEQVQLRAVLSGSSKISPILYPGTLMVAGTLQTSGTYVSRVFDMGDALRVSNNLKTFLPSGSSLTVEIDKADGVWTTLSLHAQDVINLGWQEREYRVAPWDAPNGGRIRLTLTGTPAARPLLADMRAVSI